LQFQAEEGAEGRELAAQGLSEPSRHHLRLHPLEAASQEGELTVIHSSVAFFRLLSPSGTINGNMINLCTLIF
jgi:hypothetical protein